MVVTELLSWVDVDPPRVVARTPSDWVENQRVVPSWVAAPRTDALPAAASVTAVVVSMLPSGPTRAMTRGTALGVLLARVVDAPRSRAYPAKTRELPSADR